MRTEFLVKLGGQERMRQINFIFATPPYPGEKRHMMLTIENGESSATARWELDGPDPEILDLGALDVTYSPDRETFELIWAAAD